jgi:hypothetical protein
MSSQGESDPASFHLPAFCPNCGLIFESRPLGIAPGASVENLVMEGNREQCPRCGHMAELPDGTFNIVDDTLTVLEATPLTRARLAQLADLMDRARTGAIAEEDLADELEREGGWTALADLLRKAPPRMRHALIFLLIFVVQTIGTHEIDRALDDAPTQAELHHGLSAISQQLRDDERHVESQIEQAVKTALAAYNAKPHPGSEAHP